MSNNDALFRGCIDHALPLYGYTLILNGSKYSKDFKLHQNFMGEKMNVCYAINKVHIAKN